MTRVHQTSPRKNTFGTENKWWASSRQSKPPVCIDYVDVEVGTDENDVPIYNFVESPRFEYIGPNGWQATTYYFNTAEECVAALNAVGVTDVEVHPWQRLIDSIRGGN